MGFGWEYPEREAVHQAYSIRTVWGFLPSSESLCLRLNQREEARLEAMIAWAKAHLDELLTDMALSDENIQDYLSENIYENIMTIYPHQQNENKSIYAS